MNKKFLLIVASSIVVVTLLVLMSTQLVIYNYDSHIYHKPSCKWAKACKTNCSYTFKFLIHEQHKPCKVCKG